MGSHKNVFTISIFLRKIFEFHKKGKSEMIYYDRWLSFNIDSVRKGHLWYNVLEPSLTISRKIDGIWTMIRLESANSQENKLDHQT